MKKYLFGIVFGLASLPFLSYSSNIVLSPDSVGIKSLSGVNYIIHKVEPKQGWYSISKRYGVSQDEIKNANPKVVDLQLGQLILVPIVSGANPVSTPPTTEVQEIKKVETRSEEKFKTPVYHTVKKGETLYSISKSYNSTVADIKAWNKINNDVVNLGQKLVVNYVFAYNNSTENKPVVETPPVKQEVDNVTPVVSKPVDADVKKDKKDVKKDTVVTVKSEPRPIPAGTKPVVENTELNKSSSKPNVQIVEAGPQQKLRAVNESGIAAWIEDDDINPNKFFALHRTAPAGTIIRVKNKMNGNYVYVKVVGVLPDTGDNSNLIIKLSKAAAVKLGVIDARFQADLNYGVHDPTLEEKYR